MKTEHLHDLWGGPDNSRLTSKQFSFRLPVHIAAKIAALVEMYPQKNRTQIVADLLTTALEQLEQELPQATGNEVIDTSGVQDPRFEQEEPLFYLGGPRGRFREIANRHYKELEIELGNETPEQLFPEIIGTEDYFKAK